MNSHLRVPILEPLWTSAASRAADAHTMSVIGIPGVVLMDLAGRAAADAVLALVPGITHCVVLAGPGNNGGDGWVVARHLWDAGVHCPVLSICDPQALTGDARLAADMFLTTARTRGWTAPVFDAAYTVLDEESDVPALIRATGAQVVVDALFGTGLSRPLDGVASLAVRALMAAEVPIVAIDLPTGLPSDGAAPPGPCARARLTLTFGGRKIAHASEPGHSLCGEVRVADIGIVTPSHVVPTAFLLEDALPLLPAPEPDAHKNHYGHVGVIAGRALGAARLAAMASLRAGAGLVTVFLEGSTALPEPEFMVRPFPSHMADMGDALAGISALVLGPGLGLGRDMESRALLKTAAAQGIPVVVDAEAVDALAHAPVHGLQAVVTPHPGEAARALRVTSADIQKNRLAAVHALTEVLGTEVVTVLKGSSPIIAAAGAAPVIVQGASPTLAVAGSGDVLAGCIGGLLAQGLSCRDAALLGVWAHQRAGRLLAADGAVRGWLAGEIAAALPRALAPPPQDGAGST